MATAKKKTTATKKAAKKKTTVRARKTTPAKARKAVMKRAKPSAKKTATRKQATVKKAAPVKKRAAAGVGASRKAAPRRTRAAQAKTMARDISYSPQTLEPKWQAKWEADKLYRAVIDESRPKYYALTMLPYPSGDLHIGHWYAMTPSDARARFKRMQGYNVLFPMGFDAFGLPAENAAIKDGIHPMVWTYPEHRAHAQAAAAAWAPCSTGTARSVSADPEYYKWTEWFFIQLLRWGWPIARCRRWTGARRTIRPWRASR